MLKKVTNSRLALIKLLFLGYHLKSIPITTFLEKTDKMVIESLRNK